MKKEVDYYKNKTMKKLYIITLIIVTGICTACKSEKKIPTNNVKTTETVSFKNPAKQLIADMIKVTGDYKKLKELKNVEFNYTFLNPKNGLKDVSTERYIFDGEISWGEYKTHTFYVKPKTPGTITQFYTKDTTKTTLDGNILNEAKEARITSFTRKANFYWFCMMQKLLDPGLHYELLPNRTVNNIEYKIVKVGFEKNIGNVQDDYILYINPKTHLVDQFIFTVKESKIPGQLLMKVSYEKVNDIMIMSKREIYVSDWEGTIKGDMMIKQLTNDIKFNNNFNLKSIQNN